MSEPYLGEVRMAGFNFAPRGWAFCQGQLLPINQNQALFSILGTTYGGDGIRTFALPDLRGRVPVHPGQVPGLLVALGEQSGSESVTLTAAQLPGHSHLLGSVNQATATSPTGNVFAAKPRRGTDVFAPQPATVAINSNDTVGQNFAHNNLQPYLALNFIIALTGIFPSRN